MLLEGQWRKNVSLTIFPNKNVSLWHLVPGKRELASNESPCCCWDRKAGIGWLCLYLSLISLLVMGRAAEPLSCPCHTGIRFWGLICCLVASVNVYGCQTRSGTLVNTRVVTEKKQKQRNRTKSRAQNASWGYYKKGKKKIGNYFVVWSGSPLSTFDILKPFYCYIFMWRIALQNYLLKAGKSPH